MIRALGIAAALAGLVAVAIAAGAGCRDPVEPRARSRIAEAIGAETPATCVTARGGDHGDDVSFCTNGTTLTICVEGGGCITVLAPPERPQPKEPR